MRNLTSLAIVLLVVFWASAAFAQYAALEGDSRAGPWLGIGGIYFNGDDNAVPANSSSDFLPTVNLAGISDTFAWQLFYGMSSDTTAFGGNLDYIIDNNFDECESCPDGGIWWFGAGLSIADVSDLHYDAVTPANSVDATLYGANLGFGYAWDMWAVQFYGHFYTDDQVAFQAALLYSLTSD